MTRGCMAKFPKILNVRVKSKMHDEILSLCENNETSIGEIVREALNDYLNKLGKVNIND
jgi:predicted HicB family RNase H-like nuclease